jgi:ubiquinone/menaquinone biosynthesis C-methylase UbiE
MDQYDRMGDNYISDNESSPTNEYYERPAIRSLIGNPNGLRVLDVGCGSGVLSAWLVEQGARVVAADKSSTMLAATRNRLGERAAIHQLDLSDPLPFEDGEFDLVVASLVLHYLEDWRDPLGEFWRVLSEGGRVVMSTHHPFVDWRWFDRPSYFATELLCDVWNKGGKDFTVRYWRRPLTSMVSDMRAVGFAVDQVVEPQPLAEVQAIDAEQFRSMSTEPRFLFFVLRKTTSI